MASNQRSGSPCRSSRPAPRGPPHPAAPRPPSWAKGGPQRPGPQGRRPRSATAADACAGSGASPRWSPPRHLDAPPSGRVAAAGPSRAGRRRDEQHLGQVHRSVGVAVVEGVVLLRVEHFEQRRRRVAELGAPGDTSSSTNTGLRTPAATSPLTMRPASGEREAIDRPRICASSQTPPSAMVTAVRRSALAIRLASDVLPQPDGPAKQSTGAAAAPARCARRGSAARRRRPRRTRRRGGSAFQRPRRPPQGAHAPGSGGCAS